ncbi:MAG: FHA domain-containing protein [Gemmataceae bacterium]
MSFRWYIYYCALLGGCAGYLGWALGRCVPFEHHLLQAPLRGMFVGLCIAVVLTLVDWLWNFRTGAFADNFGRLLLAGVAGALGGVVGGFLGQLLYSLTQQILFVLLGWTGTGMLIGAGPGLFDLVVRRGTGGEQPRPARRKVINGILGGTLGGFLGALVYLLLLGAWRLVFSNRVDDFWTPTATGFIALGMCIGLMIGLAQVLLKTAWITVVSGFRAGREWVLSRGEMTIGRAEGSDIPLFGNSAAEKEHARLILREGDYYIEDLNTPQGTFVNGERVNRPRLLRHGDLIEIGRSSLRFGERIKREGA